MFRRNSSTFDVIRDRRHITINDNVLRWTVSRTMGRKLVRSPAVLSGYCRRNKTRRPSSNGLFQRIVDYIRNGVCQTSVDVFELFSRHAVVIAARTLIYVSGVDTAVGGHSNDETPGVT